MGALRRLQTARAKADWSFNQWLTKLKPKQPLRQLLPKAKRRAALAAHAVDVAAAPAVVTIVAAVVVMATVVVVMTSAVAPVPMMAVRS